MTPLDSALMAEREELVSMLMDHGAVTIARIHNVAATRIQVFQSGTQPNESSGMLPWLPDPRDVPGAEQASCEARAAAGKEEGEKEEAQKEQGERKGRATRYEQGSKRREGTRPSRWEKETQGQGEGGSHYPKRLCISKDKNTQGEG